MNYQRVDLATWERGDLFRYYMEQMRIVTGMTVDICVTPLVTYAKKHDLRFYPCMLWVVSSVINAHAEFKYGWNEAGELIRWQAVSPSHVFFHGEDERFTKLVTPYHEDILVFHKQVLADELRHCNDRGILPDQPKNAFDVSALPWVHYRQLDMHVFDAGKHLAPVVTWGRYSEENGEQVLPLSMQIHHAVADGFHLSRFFVEVQRMIDQLESKDDQNRNRVRPEASEKEASQKTEVSVEKAAEKDGFSALDR